MAPESWEITGTCSQQYREVSRVGGPGSFVKHTSSRKDKMLELVSGGGAAQKSYQTNGLLKLCMAWGGGLGALGAAFQNFPLSLPSPGPLAPSPPAWSGAWVGVGILRGIVFFSKSQSFENLICQNTKIPRGSKIMENSQYFSKKMLDLLGFVYVLRLSTII